MSKFLGAGLHARAGGADGDRQRRRAIINRAAEARHAAGRRARPTSTLVELVEGPVEFVDTRNNSAAVLHRADKTIVERRGVGHVPLAFSVR